jgi:hypothetical protein
LVGVRLTAHLENRFHGDRHGCGCSCCTDRAVWAMGYNLTVDSGFRADAVRRNPGGPTECGLGVARRREFLTELLHYRQVDVSRVAEDAKAV